MKKRVRRIANFFAFNLLFFALYLNFIHKDNVATAAVNDNTANTAAFSGTVLVKNPEQFIQTKSSVTVPEVQPSATDEKESEQSTGEALKLSIN